jgi:2'-5' RNA ligase
LNVSVRKKRPGPRSGSAGICAIVALRFDDRAVEEHPIWPLGWTVRDLILIHSMKGHRHLASWPLRV